MNQYIVRGVALLLVLSALTVFTACSKKAIRTDTAGTATVDTTVGEGTDLSTGPAGTPGDYSEENLDEQSLDTTPQVVRATIPAEKMSQEDIYFDFDSYSLQPQAQLILKAKAEWLLANPRADVLIEGHCDERGTSEYNIALGDRRAETCKAFLVRMGIPQARLQTVSYGEERPLIAGHSESAWAKNRRAHFKIR